MDSIFPDSPHIINIVTIGLLYVVVLLPWALALVHVLKHKFIGDQKALWVVVLLFTGTLGAIVYFFIGRDQIVE